MEAAIKKNAGKYILVVEGALPTKENGIYMQIAQKTGLDIVKHVAASAGAVVAIGSCASWGGVPSAASDSLPRMVIFSFFTAELFLLRAQDRR